MPELSNGEQKRLLDNLTIPTKFFTNKILKRGQLEKCGKQRAKNILKSNVLTAKAYNMREEKDFQQLHERYLDLSLNTDSKLCKTNDEVFQIALPWI